MVSVVFLQPDLPAWRLGCNSRREKAGLAGCGNVALWTIDQVVSSPQVDPLRTRDALGFLECIENQVAASRLEWCRADLLCGTRESDRAARLRDVRATPLWL